MPRHCQIIVISEIKIKYNENKIVVKLISKGLISFVLISFYENCRNIKCKDDT